ncbi:dimethylaniline monooxygenase [Cercophora newfieldiana]|uniref:Dimethylaniline monooxygenase n=1 Tax=Cercophora newfieldiana TaxID=92897 RepID=A0AA39XSB5_9PEZI|nr:dimethylaniline monooxygenase [Cercophora newfieldiana]
MKVIVIGGGPAGLVTLKFLATAHNFYPDIKPIEVQLFEAEDSLGGTFKYRVWEGAELVSSKYLTAFSDFRLPKDAPDFLSPEQYVQYLLSYAKRFKILDHIRCKTLVTNVRRRQGGGHVVTTQDRETMASQEHQCDAVIVCSGLNLTPSFPTDIEGLIPTKESQSPSNSATSDTKSPHTFRTLHSSAFKNLPGPRNEFLPLSPKSSPQKEGSTVLILGAGETAHDIAYMAINHPSVSRVILSHKSGFFVAPKITPEPVLLKIWGKPYEGKRQNKPLDTTIASLFDTAYVPGWLQRGGLLWGYYDGWVRVMFWMITGSKGGFDQRVGIVDRGVDSLFMVKSDRAIQYISPPYRKGWANAIRSFFINIPLRDTQGKEIELAPWPTCVRRVDIVEFADNGSPESKRLKTRPPVIPDTVIFATGYKREFPFLDEDYPRPADCSVRGIYRDINDTFGYIGIIRPSIGAIPPLAELQTQLFISRLITHHHNLPPVLSPDALPPYELSFALRPTANTDIFRNKHGVDHESYAYQLALDMGAAPRASYVLREHGWKVFFTWAMGPNFNTKFRMVGPWAAPKEAGEVMRGELYSVVKRSGGGVFFVTYTLIPQVLFGVISLVAMAWEWVRGLFVRRV